MPRAPRNHGAKETDMTLGDPREKGSVAPSRSNRKAARGPPLKVPPVRTDFPVVALGASAGGLEAFSKLFDALPADIGMAFVLIQHLDPTHASMMVDLLTGHTTKKVQQAAEGMPLERGHVYIIPPATYLSIKAGALQLSEPTERHGARLPFDFFLRSLAVEYGERAVCVILSGTGADGSLGLKAIKETGGLVIVQSPDEAAYDGMPRSAINTDLVDFVLPVAKIPEVLIAQAAKKQIAVPRLDTAAEGDTPPWL